MKSIVFFYVIFLFGFSFAQENIIASVEFKGAVKTKSSFLKKIIEVKHKEVLDSVKLDKDIIRLKRLPAISHAYYQVFLTNDKNQYNVFYTVEENFTVIPNLNIWTSTNNQFSYKIGLYDFNFLGHGVAFGGFYQNNGEDRYLVAFTHKNAEYANILSEGTDLDLFLFKLMSC